MKKKPNTNNKLEKNTKNIFLPSVLNPKHALNPNYISQTLYLKFHFIHKSSIKHFNQNTQIIYHTEISNFKHYNTNPTYTPSPTYNSKPYIIFQTLYKKY